MTSMRRAQAHRAPPTATPAVGQGERVVDWNCPGPAAAYGDPSPRS